MNRDIMDAEEARQMGLVAEVFPAEKLDDEAVELAEKIAGYSPLELGLDALYNTEGMDLIKSLDYLNTLRVVSFLSEDLQEGAQAFMDKRSPEFTGH